MPKTHYFFSFTEAPESIIHSPESGEDFIERLINSIDRTDCEEDAILYFDRNNFDSMLRNLDALDEMSDYIGTLRISEAIQHIMIDVRPKFWNENSIHDIPELNTFYKKFDSGSRAVIDPCDSFLKEAAERMARFNLPDEKCIIVDFTGEISSFDYVCIIRGTAGEKPQIFNIDIISDFNSLESWIYNSKPNRTYNYGDNRHCLNHADYRKSKSPLIDGTNGKAHVASLLEMAIGDRKDRKFLINYDPKHNRYVRYEDEGENPQNGYHGYHLIKKQEGEYIDDWEEVKKISSRVISLIEYRKKLAEKSKNQ